MNTIIKKKASFSTKDNLIVLCNRKSSLINIKLSKEELSFVKKEQKEKELVIINQYERKIIVVTPKEEKNINQHIENCRMFGDKLQTELKDEKSVVIIDLKESQKEEKMEMMERLWLLLPIVCILKCLENKIAVSLT